MRNSPKPPVYSQIAFDIAIKIASGELAENTRFTGRSLMSANYGVSQETIRRTFNQLANMEIISVQQNIGATVLSQKKQWITSKNFRRAKIYARSSLSCGRCWTSVKK